MAICDFKLQIEDFQSQIYNPQSAMVH